MTTAIGKLSLKDLASLVAEKLSEYGVNTVLTGGACVTIYSTNKYRSFDLDFVCPDAELMKKKIKAAMDEIGFEITPNKYFKNPKSKYFIEFISSPLAVGHEPVKHLKDIKTRYGTLKLISPTDCVKDRLAAYFYWNDKQSLAQAVMVAKDQDISLNEIRKWAKVEGQAGKLADFIGLLNKKNKE